MPHVAATNEASFPSLKLFSSRSPTCFPPCKLLTGKIDPGKLQLAERLLLLRGGDVAQNPGPGIDGADGQGVLGQEGEQEPKRAKVSDLLVLSQNVRGLGDSKKVRHLINNCYKISKSAANSFFLFQETYVGKLELLRYLWRGESHLTMGMGNSLGCITLVTAPFKIVHSIELGNRGHILVLTKTDINRAELILANVYAPNGNDAEKINFFENLVDSLAETALNYECDQIFLGGDLNLVFHEREVQNRAISSSEKRVANIVKQLFQRVNLVDCWEQTNKSSFTWTSSRSGTQAFSTLDRIMHCSQLLNLVDLISDWAFSVSDHAAVIATYNSVQPKQRSNLISRLDARILLDCESVAHVNEAFRELFDQRNHQWNPHVSLEYAKMCIRSAAHAATGRTKANFRDKEAELNRDINDVVNELAVNNVTQDRKELLLHKLDDLRNLKRCLVEKIGARLEQRTARKWYNEGELSNKYFFRLMNRKIDDEVRCIISSAGEALTDQTEIENEIRKFYKDLYESVPADIDLNADLFRNIQPLDQDAAAPMGMSVTLEELEATLKTCADSAPGPDGIPYSFLRHFWQDFGPLLVSAWNYSLTIKELPPSHKVSYLRLIPKEGKDPKVLTNLRPITLSNTDHKLITKTYSKKLTKIVSSSIGEEQTAYIPGRLINDNVRSMLMTIDQANDDDEVDGVIVSLDAKKAFDSVDHRFIRKCLESFGLTCFIPIFDILYKNLNSQILINGRAVKGYDILKGVKQGDALSCILFIMCIEPLIRNIKENAEIESVVARGLNLNFPKIYSYADDVTVVAKKSESAIKQIFKEYEIFSNSSGLVLNAEKTEMLCFNKDRDHQFELNVDYRGARHRIAAVERIKVNGFWLLQDPRVREEVNVQKRIEAMERILMMWSTRHLSLLGRILIIKTFAISQFVYLFQTIKISDANLNKIMKVVDKYLWNRNFRGNKAPERLKRSIMLTPAKYGGFGLINVVDLANSLDLRSLGRTLESNHPFFRQLNPFINKDDFFKVTALGNVDLKLKHALLLLNSDRSKIYGWPDEKVLESVNLNKIIQNIKVANLITQAGRQSLHYLAIHRRNRNPCVFHLSVAEFASIERFVKEKRIVRLIKLVLGSPYLGAIDINASEGYPDKNSNLKRLNKMSSKELRQSRSNEEDNMINVFKLGLVLDPGELLSWTGKMRKLTSTRHKNILLRVAHGDIFSNSRLFKFRLRDSPRCKNCDELVESVQHRLLECPKARETWIKLNEARNLLQLESPATLTLENLVGAGDRLPKLSLALQAEVLLKLSIKSDGYCPQQIVKSAIMVVLNSERLDNEKRELFNNWRRQN